MMATLRRTRILSAQRPRKKNPDRPAPEEYWRTVNVDGEFSKALSEGLMGWAGQRRHGVGGPVSQRNVPGRHGTPFERRFHRDDQHGLPPQQPDTRLDSPPSLRLFQQMPRMPLLPEDERVEEMVARRVTTCSGDVLVGGDGLEAAGGDVPSLSLDNEGMFEDLGPCSRVPSPRYWMFSTVSIIPTPRNSSTMAGQLSVLLMYGFSNIRTITRAPPSPPRRVQLELGVITIVEFRFGSAPCLCDGKDSVFGMSNWLCAGRMFVSVTGTVDHGLFDSYSRRSRPRTSTTCTDNASLSGIFWSRDAVFTCVVRVFFICRHPFGK
ncbi:hypothetical protein BDZ89DRAFT_1038956 [Hymenopellis radicata]|nr:hypothetical protein BDZ89DRAFT_1038956 [Hymenopellis radicata]